VEIADCVVRHWGRLGGANARLSVGSQQVGLFSYCGDPPVECVHNANPLYPSVAKPSLKTVPQAEFAEQLATLLEDHMVVAFEENGVSA